MERYTLFEEMDRMFDQMRSQMWLLSGADVRGHGDAGGRTPDVPETRRSGDVTVETTDEADVERRDGSTAPATREYDSAATGSEQWGTRLVERDGEFVLVADLPGFETDDIELTFADGTLAVAASHEDGEESFARSREASERVSIPKDVDADAITASYRNGVLEVRLPLLADEDAVRRIEIDS
ncbi:Hsp20/alpha crystallin family protein [Halomicrococcus sp. NG-SE-24]|uniref:Hsp20/alpha crystallin family protein n=1 Tax=Halomicrococcus sp. NG-SE-24 TaxID=3436928 RepID=UPI003D98A259